MLGHHRKIIKKCLIFITTMQIMAAAISEQIANSNQQQKMQFELHPEKLDGLFNRAAAMALLKAKARETLKKVPKVEGILFGECLRDNGNGRNCPAKYAKCLVKLFEARDAAQRSRDHHEGGGECPPGCGDDGGTHLLGGIIKWIANVAKDFMKNQKESRQIIANRRGTKMAENKIPPRSKFRIDPSKHFIRKIKFLARRKKINRRIRRKRNGMNGGGGVEWNNDGGEQLKNIGILRRLQVYMERRDWANRYLHELSERNINFVRHIFPSHFPSSPIKFEQRAFNLASQLQSILSSTFNGQSAAQGLSILSPRLFPLFSTAKGAKNWRKNILSPDLLSFHEDGIFSMSKLFKMLTLEKSEALAWMEMLLEMTGSGKQLAKLAAHFGPEMDNFEQKIVPALQKLRKKDAELARMEAILDGKQQAELHARGYTMVAPRGGGGGHKHDDESRAEEMLEEKIKKLAELADYPAGKRGRMKRQNDGDGTVVIGGQTANGSVVPEVGGEAPDEEDGHFPRTVILTPSAFVHRVDGVIIEGVYLSPHAFAYELISPEFFTVHVLSPAAFVAVILSPMAMTARILGPWAFRAEILSPEAFTAYVLNPDVFMGEVLSPKVFEPRVLSPKSMFMQILTPIAASPRIGSPESMGLLVLSPNILSPRINSSESLLIEVLSPHILGGEHGHREDDMEMAGGAIHIVGTGSLAHQHHENEHHNEAKEEEQEKQEERREEKQEEEGEGGEHQSSFIGNFFN